jgi:hypothetical protein
MIPRNLILVVLLSFLFTATRASARLGETEAQSEARYGAPVDGLIGPQEKPLLDGAKQLAYNFQGWRIRVAFLNGGAARLEYVHIPDASGLKQITDPEAEAILDAEKGAYRWREIKPRTGNAGLDTLKTAFEGRTWERSDHAAATLKMKVALVLQSRDVEPYEKKHGREAGKTTPAPQLPKF